MMCNSQLIAISASMMILYSNMTLIYNIKCVSKRVATIRIQCRMGIQPHKRDDKREAISDGLYFIETLCEMNPILGERGEKKP